MSFSRVSMDSNFQFPILARSRFLTLAESTLPKVTAGKRWYTQAELLTRIP